MRNCLPWRFLVDHIHHLPFNRLFFHLQPILIPNEIWSFSINIVSVHASFQEADNIPIIRVLSESKSPAIVKELSELLWYIIAEVLNFSLFLLLFNRCILLRFCSSWETLPWEGAFQKVEEYVANTFKVISPWLFVSNMSVDTGISGSACQILPILEWNMVSFRALKALCQPEIDDVNCVFGEFSATNKKIVGFYVSVNDSLFMDSLYSFNHLNCNVKHSL